MKEKTFYYKDELNDDFLDTNIKTKEVPTNYRYFKNPIRRAWSFFFYYCIAVPIVFLLQKLIFREKIIGKKKLKEAKKNGYFIYANHIRAMGDAFTPTLITLPKRAYIVVSPDAVSNCFLRRMVEDLGGMPTPNSMAGLKNYYNAIKKHAQKKHAVFIYPEAHVWPFYTGIRPFKDTSFRFPAEFGKPVYTATTVLHKKRWGKGVITRVYIDGPFYPDETLSVRENQKRLRDLAYECMLERSKLTTYSPHTYIKVEEKTAEEAS